MKIALQLGLIPAKTVADKQKWAADHGADGIEVSTGDYSPDRVEQARKDFENSPVPITSVCGNPSFDFLDPVPAKRRNSIEQSKVYLKLCGQVGAAGQILPPIFGGPRIPDLSPLKNAIELENDLLVEICKELGDVAQAAGTLVLLEPLNRYEEHLLRTQANGVRVIERCGRSSVALISDFFHMHIEERNIPATIRACARHIRHMHLADNTRLEPGTGDIDYVAAFTALKEIGFKGFMAFECGVTGPDRAASLAKSIEYVRDCIRRA